MSWITDDWRLKLLAFGLAVLMLGAVAFSQNPPTSKTIQVGIIYNNIPSSLILINPPKQTTVTVTGLADLVSAVNQGNTAAAADVSTATPGNGVRVNLVGKSLVPGVTVQTTPLALNIDSRAVVQVAVVARIPRGTATGWQVTKLEAQCEGPPPPCTVTFDGSVTLQKNLKAYADYPFPVDGSAVYPSARVILEQQGTPLDLTTYTLPKMGLDITTVTIHIEAKSGTTSRQVALVDAPPANPPPTCYRVTNIAVDPISLVVTGSPEALTGVTTITLPAVDLSQHASDFTFTLAIPFPAGVTGSPQRARAAYSISRNPNCTPPSP